MNDAQDGQCDPFDNAQGKRVDIEGLECMNINGFSPVIFRIVPVTNLPLLLGIADEVPSDSEREQAQMPLREKKFTRQEEKELSNKLTLQSKTILLR